MPRWPTALPLTLLVVAAGCAKLRQTASLSPGAPAADHVALEVFFVRIPAGDQTVLGSLWSALDEQAIGLDVRRRLNSNGFLVGQVGGQLPAALTDLLQISDQAPTPSLTETAFVDLGKPPLVHRKLIDVYQTDTPNRIVITGERERHARLVVLFRDEVDETAAVRGWTYTNVRGSLLTKVHPQSDGRVKLEVVPEIEYGEEHREIAPGEGGAFTYQLAQPRKTFDSLRLATVLAPGDVLVFSCQGDRAGSLGHQFFTDRQSDLLNQIVLLIRVVQTKAGDLFTDRAPGE